MINIMSPLSKEEEAGGLDPQLWHACAGAMVQMPPVNSRVFYFPQGHIEHAQSNVDFKRFPRLPPLIPCRISSIRYLADRESDEVYARIRLIPLTRGDEYIMDHHHRRRHGDDGRARGRGSNSNKKNNINDSDDESEQLQGILEKPASFAKTLTQSDANNGGGFSVPRYCAETIFPRLDYSVEPPVQTILAKDVHGVTWKFRHIYRGTPRRHLLTTGWSNFVNQKKLVAGDSIVFLRSAEDGELCVGVRRARRRPGGNGIDSPGPGPGPGPGGGWNANCGSSPYAYNNYNYNHHYQHGGGGGGGVSSAMSEKLKGESVIEAATLAGNGQPFEAVYYPRASTPEFCVKASAVRAAMQIHWSSGMRFKMAFETEDSSRISWFMGSISSVQVADPFRWPNSPWRLLQVSWDEPDLLQNVKRVNPWLVEPVATMPVIPISPFSPPRNKKLRLPQPPDFPFLDQLLPLIPPTATSSPFSSNTTTTTTTTTATATIIRPSISSSPFCYIPNNASSAGLGLGLGLGGGIQGARHNPHYLLSDPPYGISRSLQPGLFAATAPPMGFISAAHGFICKPRSFNINHDHHQDKDISCLQLTVGSVGTHSHSHSHGIGIGTTTTNKSQEEEEEEEHVIKTPKFMLFGKPILTQEQISKTEISLISNTTTTATTSTTSDHDHMHDDYNLDKSTADHVNNSNGYSNVTPMDAKAEEVVHAAAAAAAAAGSRVGLDHQAELIGSDTAGHCKVFMQSEDVGRTLDLSVFGSYEELYKKLAHMFGMERSEVLSNVLYRDWTGATKHAGDKPFSEFLKTARRLTILTDAGGENLAR
ncbi:hypothetical protein Dimus_021228 [Dionaea muscipula]